MFDSAGLSIRRLHFLRPSGYYLYPLCVDILYLSLLFHRSLSVHDRLPPTF